MWGRAVLMALVAALLLSAAPAHAAGGAPTAKIKALAAKQQAKELARAARLANRMAKLDLHLNDVVEDGVDGESNVIVEFYDGADAVTVLKNHGGRPGRRLGILNALVANIRSN